MALQDIIDTAVNVEVNRSKLVAQNVSRNGRISTASRNWTNPFRFVVTPKPVWTAAEYRSAFSTLLENDKYLPHGFYLNNIDATTFRADLGNSWMVNYQGQNDTVNNNNTMDSYQASSATTGTMICLTNINAGNIDAGTYLFKEGDYLRLSATRYPYIATSDVKIPTAATGVTGTITAAGVRVTTDPQIIQDFPGLNVSFLTTTTRTMITVASTTGLTVGQIITQTAGLAVVTGTTYIAAIRDSTTIIIQSTADIVLTAGNTITFNGTGPTSTPTVCVPIHRGFIGTVSTNTAVLVGARGAQFVVNVTKLPQIRYLPGKLVELTGDIELIEEIL